MLPYGMDNRHIPLTFYTPTITNGDITDRRQINQISFFGPTIGVFVSYFGHKYKFSNKVKHLLHGKIQINAWKIRNLLKKHDY